MNRANDVTSTVYESFTVTETVVDVEEGEPFTVINYYTETETYYPPEQTVCHAETTQTLFYQGPPVTKWDINYVTYYTFATVFYGQTVYQTATDWPAMTRCNQGGGYYAP